MQARLAKQQLERELKLLYEESEANNIANWVIEYVTGLDRKQFTVSDETTLTDEQQQQMGKITERLLKYEPVQYVLNEAWFYGLRFYVDKNVLIPRPETEELVNWVITDLEKRDRPVNRNYKVIDVGTGSGCIAIALRKNLPMDIETWACDINDLALTVARKNADNNHALVDFVAMDFLDRGQRNQLPLVDIIVSNPPYVPLRDKDLMSANVVNHEPHTALFVPDNNSLIFYSALADFGKQKLYPDGVIYAEIHENRGHEVTALFKERGYGEIELRKDLQGKERMVRVISRLS